jgi:hypothetical protein
MAVALPNNGQVLSTVKTQMCPRSAKLTLLFCRNSARKCCLIINYHGEHYRAMDEPMKGMDHPMATPLERKTAAISSTAAVK